MAKILIVDDDKIILKIVEAALTSAGHTVVSATDGHAALEALNKESFALVIADANMPGGVSGFDLTKAIRLGEKWLNLGVMMLSGRRAKTDVTIALKSGVDDYIVKPVDSTLLLAKVEALLEKRTGNHSFVETQTSVPGSWPMDIQVIGVSEQTISFISPFSPVANSVFKINSPIFSKIGVEAPDLRLISSRPVEGHSDKFQISASFIGLSASELRAFRIWVMTNNRAQRKIS